MKKIIIEDQEFFYKVYSDSSEYAYWSWTVFFKETKFFPRFTFLWWKSKELVEKETELFRINHNIESEIYTKEEMRAVVKKAFDIYKRKEQIQRGELI